MFCSAINFRRVVSTTIAQILHNTSTRDIFTLNEIFFCPIFHFFFSCLSHKIGLNLKKKKTFSLFVYLSTVQEDVEQRTDSPLRDEPIW